MKCPIDTDVDLVMTDRSGIEIDYCPTCRGVWLDRGELDKIIERNVAPIAATASAAPVVAAAATQTAPPAQAVKTKRWNDDHDDDRDDRPRYGYDDDKKYKKKKRSSFLEEIFDF